MQENILNIIDIYKEIFDTEYYKLYKGDDATHLLYEGYCFYFAKLLYDTFSESIMCKNPSGDHYFVKIYDDYYDARDNYDENGKRCPIKKDNCGNIKDLDGTFIKPIEILNVLDEEVSCNQFGSVKDPFKDMVWEKISSALYTKRDELMKTDNLKM